MPLLFVEEAKLPKVAKVLGECPRLKIVVVLTKVKARTASSSKDKLVDVSNGYSTPAEVQKACDAAGVRLLGFDALLQSGADNPAEPSPPSGDDLAFIMYTYATTPRRTSTHARTHAHAHAHARVHAQVFAHTRTRTRTRTHAHAHAHARAHAHTGRAQRATPRACASTSCPSP